MYDGYLAWGTSLSGNLTVDQPVIFVVSIEAYGRFLFAVDRQWYAAHEKESGYVSTERH